MANLRLCTATRHNIYRPETADGESSQASAICEVRKSAYGRKRTNRDVRLESVFEGEAEIQHRGTQVSLCLGTDVRLDYIGETSTGGVRGFQVDRVSGYE
jgi:hypothetical protein